MTVDGTAVSAESLLADSTETWIITAVYDVDPTVVTTTSGDCTDDSGENGETGFANAVSGSLTDTNTDNDSTCVALPKAIIDLAKTAATPVDNGDGTWTVEYTITATNSGTGPGVYDVVENFKPGAGITLSSATVVYGGENDGSNGTITTPLTVDGTAVSAESLLADSTETWIITAVYDVDPTVVTT
ncbi:MAG: hypothetical protein GY719_39335, partial [bacterium]|nr:hypothetical protein [bacterium]